MPPTDPASAAVSPAQHGPSDDPRAALLGRIEAVLNAEVRAGLDADGGGVELVGVDEDNIVQVRMLGACQGCSSSIITLTMGIERTLKARIPEIRFVEAVP
jgi:Fe-S cluster biogenesis protein NfuA